MVICRSRSLVWLNVVFIDTTDRTQEPGLAGLLLPAKVSGINLTIFEMNTEEVCLCAFDYQFM